MNLTDYYMIKTAKIGFAVNPFKAMGTIGALYGATKGATRPRENETRTSAALKDGILTGLLMGTTGGVLMGQLGKYGKDLVDVINKSMKVI